MNEHLIVSSSKVALAEAVCAHVKQLASAAIQARGKFTVAVSGGSLPASLAPLAHDTSVEWALWHVLFVDERFVPLDHADSNYRAVNDALLRHVPIPLHHVHTIDVSLDLEACARAYAETLMNVTDGVLDLVLLGMGEDGHTASLFPGHALLQENKRMVAHIADSPKPPPSRITFTLPAIAAARSIAFVAGGAAKADPLHWIFREDRQGIPSGLVWKARPDTLWFIDTQAAARL